jgi:hypothetical protein
VEADDLDRPDLSMPAGRRLIFVCPVGEDGWRIGGPDGENEGSR